MYQLNQKNRTILRIITQLQRNGASSRAVLAEQLQLYSSTLSIRLKELIGIGLIREIAQVKNSGTAGRKMGIIDLDPAYGLFAGLYLRHNSASVKLFTLGLENCGERRVSFEGKGTEEVREAILGNIEWAVETAGKRPLMGIGAAVSSIVSGGTVINASSHFPWIMDKLPQLILQRTGIDQVHMDNDANLAALADINLTDGSDSSLLHLLVFESVPTIGSGLFLDGNLYRGSGGGAGELDEEIWDLQDSFPVKAAMLARLMVRYLSLESLFISGDHSELFRSSFEEAFCASHSPVSNITFVEDPHWVEKGAALMAIHEHIQKITGAKE